MAVARRVCRISVCAGLVALACALPAAAQEPLPAPTAQETLPPAAAENLTVVDVQIQGNEQIELARISPLVRTRAGRPFDPQLVEEDVRKLIRSRMFIDVRPQYQHVPGGVIVVFQVVERRTIKYVRYIGRVKVRREKTLADKSGIKAGDALDPFAVEEGRRRLEEFYQERGHSKVHVTIMEGDKPQDRGVVYLIHEGPVQRISKVEFVGNSNIVSGRRLQTQIQSRKPYFFFFKGFVDRNKIDEDVEKLTAYYRSLGFFQAKIGRETEWDEDRDRMRLTFVINEGPRFKLRDVRFMGNTKFPTDELATKLTLERGEFFDQQTMDKDVNAIQDVYGGTGYIFANIIAEPRFLEEPGTLDLVYRIEEGARYRIGSITVKIGGENPHTKQSTVLNRLSLFPGDIADIRELRASETRLKRSSIFLNNPAQGSAPRIVFSQPENDVENVAASPRAGGVRGQSPDDAPHVVRRPAVQPGERLIDLVVTDLPEMPPPANSPPPLTTAPGSSASAHSAHASGANFKTTAPAPQVGVATEPAPPAIRGQAPSFWTSLTQPLRVFDLRTWTSRQSLHRGTSAGETATEPAPATAVPPGDRTSAATSGRARGVESSPAVWSSERARPLIVRGQDGWAPFGGTAMPGPNSSGLFGRRAPAPTSLPSPIAQPPRRTPEYVAQAPVPSTETQPMPPYGPNPYSQSLGTPAPGVAPSPYSPPASYAPAPPGTLPPPSGYESPDQLFPEGGYLNEEPTQDVPVVVEVEETQTGRIMLGAGINSNAGLIGNFILDEQNFDISRFPRSWREVRNGTAFRGAGQQFRLEAVPGTRFQRYSATFREPYLFNTPISFSVSGFLFNRQYRDWLEERLGGNLSWGYQIRPDLSGTIGLRAENVNLSSPAVPTPVDLQRSLGNNGLYTVRFGLVQDTRDSAFLPTEGHRIDFGYEQAFGEFIYPRLELDLRKHFLLRQRADGSGRHTLTVSQTTNVGLSTLPIFENNFAGGFATIRGYQFRGASPRDLNVISGGRFMFLASMEYLFPITADDMLRGVIFCDTGTVETDVRFTAANYRVAPGFGFRINIPAMGPAPIALDFAFPVHSAPGDQVQNFSFFVGFNR